MYTSTRKSTFTLVTLQIFSISGVISAEKMYSKLKIDKFADTCMTGGMHQTPREFPGKENPVVLNYVPCNSQKWSLLKPGKCMVLSGKICMYM